MDSAPSPQLFFETINAFQRTSALKAAIDLDVFTVLGRGPSNAEALAAACNCPVRGIRILADNLVILGFLTKTGENYDLSADSRVFLDRNSLAYLGNAANFLLAPSLTTGFDDLAKTIRDGLPAPEGTVEANHPVWVEFARSMAPLMRVPSESLANLVTLPDTGSQRVLDISASHGAYGIAIARKHPNVHLVALDWPAVLEVTRENAVKAGLQDRFSTIAGDAFTVDLGTGFDLVLIPNFLHHFSQEDCVTFLRRIHAALNPGGQVAVVEFVPDADRVNPPAAASFSLVMLGTTPAGDAYTFEEYRTMLERAGFTGASFHPMPPTAQSAIVGVRG